MAEAPVPLTEEEIGAALREVPGWRRVGEEISRSYAIRYHGGVAMIVHVADVQRLIGHGHTPTSTCAGTASGSVSPPTMPGTG